MSKPFKAIGNQIGGTHYKIFKIQPIEYCIANNIPFAEGNVIKYVTRHTAKGKASDIRKAIHMLELILEETYNESYNNEPISKSKVFPQEI